jgi:hypothetical protein
MDTNSSLDQETFRSPFGSRQFEEFKQPIFTTLEADDSKSVYLTLDFGSPFSFDSRHMGSAQLSGGLMATNNESEPGAVLPSLWASESDPKPVDAVKVPDVKPADAVKVADVKPADAVKVADVKPVDDQFEEDEPGLLKSPTSGKQ